MKCATSVADSCVGKSVAGDSGFTDASFKKFVSGAVNVFASGLNIFLSTSTQAFTLNIMKGINALRCAVVSFGENAWNFIAAAWWLPTNSSNNNLSRMDLMLLGHSSAHA